MIFEQIVYISIIVMFLAYYVYKYVKNVSKIAILNIALQVISITILIQIYANNQNDNILMGIVTFVFGVVIPALTFILMQFKINPINEITIIIANICKACNKLDRASTMYQKLIPKYQKYRVYKNAGEVAIKKNDLVNALEYLQKAISLKPNKYRLYYKIAYIQYYQNKYEESITILNNVLKVKPNYIIASNLLANIYTFKTNEYDKALQIYFNILENDKSNAKVCYNIGAIYIKEKQNKNAKKFLQMAITYDKKMYNAYYLLGYIHLLSKEYEISEKYLQLATKSVSRYALSYYMLARLYMLQNEKGKATNCLNLSIAKDSSLCEHMHSEKIFAQVKDLASGVDKIEKIANEKEVEENNNIVIDVESFEEFNVDEYIVFEEEESKAEVLATTVKYKKNKKRKN